MTPPVVGRIRQLAKAKRGRRSRSTRQIAATRGTLISHTSIRRALHSKGVKPYVQPQVPLQRYGDKQRRLRFAAEQKERDWRVVCLLMRRHLCVILAQIVATTSYGLMIPAPSNPSCVSPTQAPSTPSVLSLHRANRLCSFFLRILLHRSTSRFLNPLCCRQREIGFLADTGPITRQRSKAHCKIDVRLVARPCARRFHAGSGHRAHQTSTP